MGDEKFCDFLLAAFKNMATRDRKPKPTALKVLEGSPGKRPLNTHEPVPPRGNIEYPDWLEDEAKWEWERLAPSLEAMGVLTGRSHRAQYVL